MTCDPSLRNDCANSHPNGPPPMTNRRRGSAVKSKTFSLVKYPASARPGIVGVFGRRSRSDERLLESQRVAFNHYSAGSDKPRLTEKHSDAIFTQSPCGVGPADARAGSRRIRSITHGKSTLIPSGVCAPKSSAVRISAYSRACG